MIDLLPKLLTDMHQWFLVFGRFVAIFMFFPGFRSQQVPTPIRLIIVITFSAMITPIVSHTLPQHFTGWVVFLSHFGKEFLIGLFFAMIAQLLMATLEMAGEFLGVVSGLGNANLFNPATGESSAAATALLGTAGITILFCSDLYLVVFKTLVESFYVFNGSFSEIYHDSATTLLRGSSKMFAYSLQFAYPFLITGIVLQVAMSMLGRLVPTMQVFLTALPMQVLLTFFVLLLIINGLILKFSDIFLYEFTTLMQH